MNNSKNSIKLSQSEEKDSNKKIFNFKTALLIVSIILIIIPLYQKTRIFSHKNQEIRKTEEKSYYSSERECETINSEEYCYRSVNVDVEYYIFDLSDEVSRTHVSYRNRYGIQLAADLYTPKNLDTTKKYSGIVIGPPYGGVKEQGPGVYANELAKRGFVALTFDPFQRRKWWFIQTCFFV